jgi:putative IMPACT (imprinted ancient) family translation regulator
MDAYPYPNRPRLVLTRSIAVGVALIAGGLIFLGGGLHLNFARSDLAATIDEKAAQLNATPRTIELTSEKSMRVRNAIKHDDFAAANGIAREVLANSHLQNWRFHPFSDFIKDITDVNDPTFEAHLNAWVALNKNDAIPLLIRAQYYTDTGWFKRGDRYAHEIQADHLTAFQDYMSKALADADTSIRLNDGNPYAFYLKLRVLLGLGMRNEMKGVFEQAIAKYPGYFQLYSLRLRALEPKWGGTVGAMYDFINQYAGGAADNSPLKLLYLSLYRALLDTASSTCTSYGRDKDFTAQCVTSLMQKIIMPALEEHVPVALQLYDLSDHYQFGIVVEEILFDMLKMAGGDRYSGAILQLAATAMHSNTQLKEDKPNANSYVIDKAVSESWYLKGFYDNAMSKDQEALKDVESTAFPSEEDKDLAVAGIYENIGGVHNKLNQYADMIAYEQAAIALGNVTDDEHFICYGYFRLKDNDAAVRACTKTIENQPSNLQARYWRGDAYRDLGQTDAALRDLTVVAESENDFRTYAAIDISMIYFDRNDNRSALDVLNKYKYLYDPATNNKEGIAVSYNNRCYAYMQLDQLKDALDDCTASLKYGSLPDAYRKQQELVKRLGAHEEGL